REMFANVSAARDAGVNLAFFSGNAVCGRILVDDRVRAFERIGVFGPPGGTREFKSMKSLEHERPYANELIGAHSTGPVIGGADFICTKPDHWIYAGTGMKADDRIPGLIGWEWHGDPADIPGLEIVATGPKHSVPKCTPNPAAPTRGASKSRRTFSSGCAELSSRKTSERRCARPAWQEAAQGL